MGRQAVDSRICLQTNKLTPKASQIGTSATTRKTKQQWQLLIFFAFPKGKQPLNLYGPKMVIFCFSKEAGPSPHHDMNFCCSGPWCG